MKTTNAMSSCGELDRLVDRNWDIMYRFALRWCRSPEHAKEAVQDTFCGLVPWIRGKTAAGGEIRDLEAAAWKFLRNKLTDAGRLAANRNHFPIDSTSGKPAIGQGAAVEVQASARRQLELWRTSRRLLQLVQELPVEQRDAFVAIVIEGKTQQAYADSRGDLSQATVSRLLKRAKDNLRGHLTMPDDPTHENASPLQRAYRATLY